MPMRWGVVIALSFAVPGTARAQAPPAPSAGSPAQAPPAPALPAPAPSAPAAAPSAAPPTAVPPPPYAVPPRAVPPYAPPGYFPPGYFPPPDDGARYSIERVETGEEGDAAPGLAIMAASVSTFVPAAIGLGMMGLADLEGGPLVAGFAVASLGLVVGPSVGHWYAGEGGRGAATMGLRFLAFGGGAGLAFGGIAVLSDSNDTGAEAGGFTLVGLASVMGAAGLGLVIWDLADAGEAARRSNREDLEDRWAAGPRIGFGVGRLSAEWSF